MAQKIYSEKIGREKMKLTEEQMDELAKCENDLILREAVIHIAGIYNLCTTKIMNFCCRHDDCAVFYFEDNCPVCLKIGALERKK